MFTAVANVVGSWKKGEKEEKNVPVAEKFIKKELVDAAKRLYDKQKAAFKARSSSAVSEAQRRRGTKGAEVDDLIGKACAASDRKTGKREAS